MKKVNHEINNNLYDKARWDIWIKVEDEVLRYVENEINLQIRHQFAELRSIRFKELNAKRI